MAFAVFTRKLLFNGIKCETRRNCEIARLLSYQPKEYGDDPSPVPIFIKKDVQSLLQTLTRIDLSKVYRRRKLGGKLHQPTIKFMTDAELEETMNKIRKKVDAIIQVPPVVPVRKPIDKILSYDPELQGLDKATFIFTDITFGIRNADRTIAVREPDGTLRAADWELRDRMNQLYFPVPKKQLEVPKMFQDEYLEDLLKRKEYEYILDRACWQFEPDDSLYQKTTSVTYQCIDENREFESIRSTRHFGSFAFFLAWNKMIENLLLDLIETSRIDECHCLIELYKQIHNVKFDTDDVLLEYINKHSTKKATLELAYQAYKNALREKQELEKGIKAAHGYS